MRILLDENVPQKLKYRFGAKHEASTVQECGWSGVQNGALLSAAEGEFDVFLTLDRNLEFQQDLTGKKLSVIVLKTKSSAYLHVRLLMPNVLNALEDIVPGSVVHVSG